VNLKRKPVMLPDSVREILARHAQRRVVNQLARGERSVVVKVHPPGGIEEVEAGAGPVNHSRMRRCCATRRRSGPHLPGCLHFRMVRVGKESPKVQKRKQHPGTPQTKISSSRQCAPTPGYVALVGALIEEQTTADVLVRYDGETWLVPRGCFRNTPGGHIEVLATFAKHEGII
jgi:hypothetical protein